MSKNKKKFKHLDYIQAIISRMGQNSFSLKGFTGAVIVALFGLIEKNDLSLKFMIMVFIVIIMFWYLDGYFLYQERLYRQLYNQVSKMKEKDINFQMDISKFTKEIKLRRAMFSKTLIVFYLSILVCLLILVSYDFVINFSKSVICF